MGASFGVSKGTTKGKRSLLVILKLVTFLRMIAIRSAQ